MIEKQNIEVMAKKENIMEDSVKIAYFILVHRFPEQFKRLFRSIYDNCNCYVIHLDKKSDPETILDIREFLKEYTNVYVLESENVVWGGYSMVQAELNGIKYLLSVDAQWDFFINLSGQDFPLRSQDYVRSFLSANKGRNFIKIARQATERPDTMNRIEKYYTETDTGFAGIPYDRPFLNQVVPYIGGQWMILTRTCCEFICTSPETRKFEDYYKNTLIPDESFFQTLLMNTSFDEEIVNDDKRAIIWIPDGTIKLRPKTFTLTDKKFLLEGNNLFARKFDDSVDNNIIDAIEVQLNAVPLLPSHRQRKSFQALVS